MRIFNNYNDVMIPRPEAIDRVAEAFNVHKIVTIFGPRQCGKTTLARMIAELEPSTYKPIQITGKRNNAVIIGEDDWRAIQETLYLLSIPKMRESIRKGLKTP